jgi:hypothetical protein
LTVSLYESPQLDVQLPPPDVPLHVPLHVPLQLPEPLPLAQPLDQLSHSVREAASVPLTSFSVDALVLLAPWASNVSLQSEA